jgi:hypothetical protein
VQVWHVSPKLSQATLQQKKESGVSPSFIGVVSGREGIVGCFGNSRESGGTIVRTTYTLGPASPDNAEEGTEDDSPVSV